MDQDPFLRRTQNPKSRQREPKEGLRQVLWTFAPSSTWPSVIWKTLGGLWHHGLFLGGLFLGVHNGQQTCSPPRFVEGYFFDVSWAFRHTWWILAGFPPPMVTLFSGNQGTCIWTHVWQQNRRGLLQDFEQSWKNWNIQSPCPFSYIILSCNSPLRGLWESFFSRWSCYPHSSALLLGNPRSCKNTWYEIMKEIIVA